LQIPGGNFKQSSRGFRFVNGPACSFIFLIVITDGLRGFDDHLFDGHRSREEMIIPCNHQQRSNQHWGCGGMLVSTHSREEAIHCYNHARFLLVGYRLLRWDETLLSLHRGCGGMLVLDSQCGVTTLAIIMLVSSLRDIGCSEETKHSLTNRGCGGMLVFFPTVCCTGAHKS